jgi:hypothetical protein
MSRRFALSLAVLVLAAAMGATPSQASDCTMEILVDGRPLAVHPHRGTSYVEAVPSREYAIRLTNRTGERVAVALAVDGLNSIDAKHASARDAQKWILGPWQTVTLPGWQTSSGTARRFVFTTEARSYGAWLGRTADLGVVSAAFFRERRRPEPMPLTYGRADEGGGVSRDAAERKCAANAPTAAAPSAKDDLAATGIGRRVDHRVVRIDFDEEDAPATVVSLRYEYHDALVRLGVLPTDDDGKALARRERARGFSDGGFAPDPFGGR